MNGEPFTWPENAEECAALARSMFISKCVSNARYWIDWGSHLVTHPQPDKPYVRSWNDAAKEDRAFREAFATLNEQQRTKVLELLQRCIHGAVFSTLCTLDQFPHGEAEVFVSDGVCGSGTRSFRIAPTGTDLHDDFTAEFGAQPPTGNDRNT
jgi:hypothetical protein